jgi:phosphoadenosine phosphosulfate reductase
VLRYTDITGAEIDKVQAAVDRLRAFEPEGGYFVAFSGGKDSQCIYHLCVRAGVKFDAHYNVTSVDPPELVHFIKTQYPDVSVEVPHDKDGRPITMWTLIPQKKMPPTRLVRYCCDKLKEQQGQGRVVVTGVRWAESDRRKKSAGVVNVRGRSVQRMAESAEARITKQGGLVLNYDGAEARRLVEQCYRTRKTLINPIVDWLDEDVWEYLNEVERVPHCVLYDRGYERLGCIGCPMNTKAGAELEAYPKYRDNYLRAFDRMLKERLAAGLANNGWKNAQDVMDWWLGKAVRREAEGQMDMMEEFNA